MMVWTFTCRCYAPRPVRDRQESFPQPLVHRHRQPYGVNKPVLRTAACDGRSSIVVPTFSIRYNRRLKASSMYFNRPAWRGEARDQLLPWNTWLLYSKAPTRLQKGCMPVGSSIRPIGSDKEWSSSVLRLKVNLVRWHTELWRLIIPSRSRIPLKCSHVPKYTAICLKDGGGRW
jgi:hypothetical protein